MSSTSPKTRDLGLLLLRLAFGLLIALAHGWGKVDSFFAGSDGFPDPLGLGARISLGLAALGEFVGGLLVALGAFTRIGAALAGVTMAVAFFVHHGGDPFGQRELAFVYLVAFVVVWLAGAGRFSVDAWRKRRKG